MSYKNDSSIVILGQYSKASDIAKAELFETYDRIRDLTVSGPALGGSGMGKFGSLLMNVARTFGSSAFLPTFGSEAINIPGTSYYTPITGGTGIIPGGQAAFGLAPFSQVSGFPTGGAAPIDNSSVTPLSYFSSMGIGAMGNPFIGLGDNNFSMSAAIGGLDGGFLAGGAAPVEPDLNGSLAAIQFGNGVIAGGASGLASSITGMNSGFVGAASTGAGLAAGTAAGAGFGRNWVMPAAGIVSGIGGLLTTLGPFFGPFGIAAAAGGAVMNGAAGAVLQSFQHVSNRILNNADTILTNKVKNLETTIKQLDAQEEVIKKLLKESLDGDRKALDNL